MNWLIAFLHHLIAFTLVAALVYEWLLIHKPITGERIQSLVRTDRIYGACALLLLMVGALRVFYFEKGSEYYFHSLPFIAKLVLFALVGIFSIYPTLTFLRWRKLLDRQQLPSPNNELLKKIKILISLELIGLIGILLCAAMAAKGVGYIS